MDKLGRLERVDLREIWETEAQHFTPWLAAEENLSVLAETLGMELELDAQEANVGPFRADILCRNSDGGSWVLIENQLERTDHGHLGQLLTYAAGLHAVTICWVAERFTEEHRATLDWLNEITGDHFRFFGLEVEAWRIGDSLPAPKFNMVSRPNDWSRSVAPPKEMTPKRRLQQEFWAALMKHLEERGGGVRRKKPQPENWMDFSVGRSEFWLETRLHAAEKWIGVALFMNGPDAAAYYALLERQRAEIERDLGVLEWRALPDRKSSSIWLRLKGHGPTAREGLADSARLDGVNAGAVRQNIQASREVS